MHNYKLNNIKSYLILFFNNLKIINNNLKKYLFKNNIKTLIIQIVFLNLNNNLFSN